MCQCMHQVSDVRWVRTHMLDKPLIVQERKKRIRLTVELWDIDRSISQ